MIGNKTEMRLHVLGSSCHVLIETSTDQADELLQLARTELGRLEEKFSSYAPTSIISALNQNAGTGGFTSLDAEARSLFNYVSALWDQSSHMFDPSTRLLQDCYDASGRLLASEAQLQEVLKLVDWSGLEVGTAGARLPDKGMVINLDNCIRPYAVDCVKKLMLSNGVSSGLVEMDQDAASIGRKADGSNWLVGLRYPKGAGTAITRLKLSNGGYAMRGNFEQRIRVDGENFSRALSPVDGHPIPGLLSVAVVAENCLTACSAASIARLKTEQAGISWLEKLGLPWLAIDRQLNIHGPLGPG